MNSEFTATRDGIAQYILSTLDLDRSDRLSPAHFTVFLTNPMSVAHGACGIALFLKDYSGELPPSVEEWLLRRPLSTRAYPPGLYFGLAGIAWVLYELGLHDRAAEAMQTAYQSPLLYRDPTMFVGAAGWGLASLHLYRRTQEPEYLAKAVAAGDYLISTAESREGGCSWRYSESSKVHYGYGYGSSGIALFLLYLGLHTGREDYISTARQAVGFELQRRIEGLAGWSWPKSEDAGRQGRVLLPYFQHGSAGIGAVVARFYRYLGEEYRSPAEKIAESLIVKWTMTPGLFEGLGGIAEFMLDMFEVGGQEHYREHARDMAETILWYRIEKPEGYAFPGRWLVRISNDYGTGSAGIGLLLNRLIERRGRWFLDFDREPIERESANLPARASMLARDPLAEGVDLLK